MPWVLTILVAILVLLTVVITERLAGIRDELAQLRQALESKSPESDHEAQD